MHFRTRGPARSVNCIAETGFGTPIALVLLGDATHRTCACLIGPRLPVSLSVFVMNGTAAAAMSFEQMDKETIETGHVLYTRPRTI